MNNAVRIFWSITVLPAVLLSSCYKGQSVDLVIHNARIHTMDNADKVYEAMAIRDGKIVEVGPDRQIQNKYAADEMVDAEGKDVYPGFTDAHAHMLSLAQQKLSADLTGSVSMDEMLVRVEKYASRTGKKCIVGRGWDQSLWLQKDLPSNERLNEIFPDIPVILFRVDGHAALVNDCLLRKAGISPQTKIEGGIVHVSDGKCTGLLVDNAIEPANKLVPRFSDKEMSAAMEEIQQELFQYGITGVHEAGIHTDDIAFFRSLIDSKKLSLNLYAMLYPSKENIAFARKQGVYRYKNLSIRSFKVIADGALGSRGACLKEPYHDQPGHYGVLTTPIAKMREIAEICEETGYQMNTHAIGDSTNRLVIDLMEEIYRFKKDHRWRIEHAQVLTPSDIARLGRCGAFLSVQPTHAVSDQRWASERLGEKRMEGAYAYRSLLEQTGMFAIGTDFPVESMDPFGTIHAAVQRRDKTDFPAQGFRPQEAITLLDCLRGMTLWSAFAAFEEDRLGSLEKGKDATFAIFEQPVVSSPSYRENFAWMTFIKGKKVYSTE